MGDPAMITNYTLTYTCDPLGEDLSNNYWQLEQVFNTANPNVNQTEVNELQNSVFLGSSGFGFILFQ